MSAASTSTSNKNKNALNGKHLPDIEEQEMPPIDEETRQAIHRQNNKIQEIELNTMKSGLEVDKFLSLIRQDIKAVNDKLQQMVTKTEFAPIKMLVYGFTATVLSGALGAILSLVFIHRS